jgi:predicted GTPase
MAHRRVIIMGAAGRDFHTFNVLFRNDPSVRIVAFTAAQIPNIADRCYPPQLAGPFYPDGVPILPESALDDAIRRLEADEVIFAYSDVSFTYVMERAVRVAAAGADFRLVAPARAMLTARIPVIAVVAVRTGCGKSPTSRFVCRLLRNRGFRVVVVRHPMPYGVLERQRAQRFATLDDLRHADCTIEEQEEYEPHILARTPVFAGVDYAAILHAAEREADVIVWDGGNNDAPFFRPDLTITLIDPHRPGDEATSYPGAVNLRCADVVLITKVDTAPAENVAAVRESIARINPRAAVIEAALPITVDDPASIDGRSVLAVEDGPTVTHGGMRFGAAMIAAQRYGASAIVDPRPYAVGSIAQAFQDYPHLDAVLPAVGYGADQIRDLAETIRRTPCDLVILGTPVDLRRLVTLERPVVRVRYELEERTSPGLAQAIDAALVRFQHEHGSRGHVREAFLV